MKDFLLLANINAITYKEFFPLLKGGKANTGYVFNKTLEFETPEGETKKQTGICWYTTFPVIHKHLVLTKTYNPQDFQAYDNYNAINVDRVKDIPWDYDGVIGCPITILDHNLDNVEVMGIWNDKREEADFIIKGTPTYLDEKHKSFQGPVVDGKAKYSRVLIKKNYSPEQFEIIGFFNNYNPENVENIDGAIYGEAVSVTSTTSLFRGPVVNGKALYFRVLIRRKK